MEALFVFLEESTGNFILTKISNEWLFGLTLSKKFFYYLLLQVAQRLTVWLSAGACRVGLDVDATTEFLHIQSSQKFAFIFTIFIRKS